MMKTMSCLVSVLTLSLLSAAATPLDQTRISADAKWVLHLDGDRFKTNQLGAFLIDQLLDKKLAKAKADLQREFGFTLDWRKIQSITAYGTTYQKNDPSGLLIVESGLEVESLLQKLIERKLPVAQVEKIEGPRQPIYRLNKDIYLSVLKGGMLLLSKSQPVIEHGQAILAGSKPNLGTANLLKAYPETPSGFFFLAVAEDFARLTKLPPNAAILKQAEGGRLTLGEQGGQLRLNLDLRAKSAEVAQQIKQVAEGLVSMAALYADQHPDLKLVIQGASASVTDRLLTLGLELPMDEVVKKLAKTGGPAKK